MTTTSNDPFRAIRVAIATLEATNQHLAAAMMRRFLKPNWFHLAEDPEYGASDPAEIAEMVDLRAGEIMEVEGAVAAPSFFVALVPRIFGDDDWHLVANTYESEAEARAAARLTEALRRDLLAIGDPDPLPLRAAHGEPHQLAALAVEARS
ncbi:MAG: hypothetical protein AAGM38_09850 [Pseudomonadota bacterium]